MKRSLKKRTFFGIAGISLILTFICVFVSYSVYARTMDDHYAMVSQHVADTAALGIDGDKIEGYYKAVQELDESAPDYVQKLQAIKDEDYHRMLSYLYDIREANDALYLYVEIFDFDKMRDIYIMDADEQDTAGELGYSEELPEDMRVYMNKLNEGFPPVFTRTKEFGPMVTSGRPIFNSKGEVAALAMVDISMQKVWYDRHNFLILITTLMLIAGAALGYLFVYMSDKMMVVPINKLAEATSSYATDKGHTGEGLTAIEQLEVKTGDEIENLC
ncbi:MAG: hypothetical protein RR315_04170, partial [Oscillospiraceae bacterium]